MAAFNPACSTCCSSGGGKVRASHAGVPPASRIFIGNLSIHTRENTIQMEFSRFGQILEVELVKDERTKKPKGYGFLQFSSQESALLAMEEMDSTCIDGRKIRVELAKPSRFVSYPIASGPPLEAKKSVEKNGPPKGDTV